ncbi:efflux RND transporter periplasmic adaptor subunit [Dyella caseinilytica]|uniref:Efflux RND transporter periplasmic adaptor subunit n=1 Tax=Dyella caseinilytica TaxID=1849581 RepID=A0ABX7GUM2_9GAMM|nr:HlyD family efflux transporter periplasmic adaptor subunit [Dyella caseinilytica]QRN53658.1 efflux RND transporter periplasmic adaptor subunit [Dyella caseinilytica]GFZ88265.1 multidrug resistance protein [Dyella caseinilytica]
MSSPNPNTADTSAVQAPAPNNRRGFLLRLLLVVLVLAAIGWTAWYFLDGRWYEGTDDAYVNGNIVQITPRINGTVISIGADDGDVVKKGDVMVQLDRSDADVELQRAAANLASTVRRVRGLYSTVQGAQAQVAVEKVALQKAQADYNRRRDLAKTGAISAEELSHALDALTAAQSALTTSQQQLQTNQVLVDDTVVASHPDVKAAAAQYRSAYLDDVRTTMVAPVTGYVAKRTVQVGQRVQPGAALMAVVPLHEVWVDANFKETQLTQMRIGQSVEVTADVYGSAVKYKAQVQSLGVGTGSAFSLLPAQNATGNWIKIVQRIPVRVVFTDPSQLDKYPLRIGMSLNTDVNLHDQNGPMLSQTPRTEPLFSTDVYNHQLVDANEKIAQIIHENMGGR